MKIIIRLIYIIILFGINVKLSLLKDNYEYFIENVASIFHKDWRDNFLLKNPYVKNRFKLTKYGKNYNLSDFIYPMNLTVGLCFVHRNLKIAHNHFNSSIIYVDILNMKYNELPSDWSDENRATAKIACKYIIQGLRNKRLFNQNYIEEISNIIHIKWMIRNNNTSQKELMIPYEHLPELEKDKDRRAVLVACRIYNQHILFRIFNTTPIHFIGRIKLLH